MKADNFKKHIPLILLTALLLFMIVCPLVMILPRRSIVDGRLDFYRCADIKRTETLK